MSLELKRAFFPSYGHHCPTVYTHRWVRLEQRLKKKPQRFKNQSVGHFFKFGKFSFKKKITFWNFELIRPKNVNYSLCNLCTKICVHRELFPQLNRIFYPFSHLSLNCIKRIFMYSYQCEITPHLLGLITFQYIINPVLIETSCHHVVNHNSTFFFPRSIFIVLRYITLCFKDPLIYQIQKVVSFWNSKMLKLI